ncbi:MAG: phosphoenolpyruvate--protein phosphotransferase, partial [Acidocella sp. 35-58-6]
MKPTEAQPSRRREMRFSGHPISPGIGIGPVYEASEPVLNIQHKKIAAADIAAETARLEDAISLSRKQLIKLKTKLASLPEQSQTEIDPLIDAYLHMLGNSRLIRGARLRVSDTLLAPEAAVMDEAEAQAEAILALTGSDKVGRQRRAEEVREIARRILRNLTRLPFRNFTELKPGTILAAESLRPAD